MNERTLTVRLAAQELWFERRIFFFNALGLAAVLAPLILLFAIKFGVIDIMLTRLLDDPRNREITVLGNQSLPASMLTELSLRDDVAFLAPRTSSLTTQQFCAAGSGSAPREIDCLVIPSGPGDPLLPESFQARSDASIHASADLLDALGVEPGGTIRLRVPRRLDGVAQNTLLDLTIAGAVERANFGRAALFVPSDLLLAIEDYQLGYGSPAAGLDGPERQGDRDTFASFRLYAADLEAVAVLADHLTANGVPVQTRAADIRSVQALNESLSIIFLIVAILAGVGYSIALAAMLWGHVERKRRSLSILKLLGISHHALAMFPIAQAATIALTGAAAATVFSLIAAIVVNLSFADGLVPGERIADIRPVHVIAAWAITLAAAVFAALAAARRAGGVDPVEGIRDA